MARRPADTVPRSTAPWACPDRARPARGAHRPPGLRADAADPGGPAGRRAPGLPDALVDRGGVPVRYRRRRREAAAGGGVRRPPHRLRFALPVAGAGAVRDPTVIISAVAS